MAETGTSQPLSITPNRVSNGSHMLCMITDIEDLSLEWKCNQVMIAVKDCVHAH